MGGEGDMRLDRDHDDLPELGLGHDEAERMHDVAVLEGKRKALVASSIAKWQHSGDTAGKKVWSILTSIMVFVGQYPGFAGADKKQLALDTFHEFLKQTNSPGPDYVVDRALLWVVEYGVDALYDAFSGKFDFDGTAAGA